MTTDHLDVRVPEAMWASMRLDLEALVGIDPNQQRLYVEEGTFVELRLIDATVKTVLVRADACIASERYEEWGIRAEKYGPPRFTAEDIESWGYYEWVRQPSWQHPFKKAKEWKVRVWANGQLGDTKP